MRGGGAESGAEQRLGGAPGESRSSTFARIRPARSERAARGSGSAAHLFLVDLHSLAHCPLGRLVLLRGGARARHRRRLQGAEGMSRARGFNHP